MPNASKRDYEVALAGLQFPASKAAILNRARDNGGIDREVPETLERLKDRPYDSMDDLRAAIRDLYVAAGVSPDEVPV